MGILTVGSVFPKNSSSRSRRRDQRAEAAKIFTDVKKLTEAEQRALAEEDVVMSRLQNLLAKVSGSADLATAILPETVDKLTREQASAGLQASEGTVDELSELIELVLANYKRVDELVKQIDVYVEQLDAYGQEEIADQIDDCCAGQLDFISEEMDTLVKEMNDKQTSMSTKIEQAKEHLNQSYDSIATLSRLDETVQKYIQEREQEEDARKLKEEDARLQKEEARWLKEAEARLREKEARWQKEAEARLQKEEARLQKEEARLQKKAEARKLKEEQEVASIAYIQ